MLANNRVKAMGRLVTPPGFAARVTQCVRQHVIQDERWRWQTEAPAMNTKT